MNNVDPIAADFAHYLLSKPAVPVADQRRSPRIGIGSRAKMRLVKKGLMTGSLDTVMIRDMSVEGVGILHESAMRPGDEFVLIMPGTDQLPVERLCSVKRCERGGMGGNSFMVGASFKEVRPQ